MIKKFFLIIVLFNIQIDAVTLVYNLRIRRIFAVSELLERMKSRLLATAVPIFFARNSEIEILPTGTVCEKRRAGGSLFNMRYVFSKHWWVEATTGYEKDHGCFSGADPFEASRTGFDDLVLTGGYRHFFGKSIQGVVYGLVGLPTRRKITLCDRFGPLVGTRLYNIGFGVEASHAFVSERLKSFSTIFQGRFIHGFNRCWFPILPEGSEIQPGNVTDLLFVLQYRKRRTIFETGYDATIFSNQALLLPTQTIETSSFIRHGVYASISHGLFKGFFNKPFIFGGGFNASYAKRFNTKTFTAWVFATIVF